MVSLAIDVGVCTLGADRVSVAGRFVVGSTLGAGACIAVTDQVIWVLVCCTLGCGAV